MWSLAELGRFAEASVRADMGLRFGDTVQHPFTRLLAHAGAGIVHVRKGEPGDAVTVLERGLEISRAAQLGTLGYWGLVVFQASALTQLGRASEAVPMLEEIVEDSAQRGVTFDHLLALTPLGEALLAVDRTSDAREIAARALELSVRLKQRGQQAYVLRLMAETQRSRSDDEAIRSYGRALALAEELGMRPLQAHCHLGLGKLYRRVGRTDEARTELTTAVAMLREMGMTFWLPDAEAALAAVS
jgi:tetratricopeptide (TPR) repeat protein